MKKAFFLAVLFLSLACANEEKQVVELSCGQCQFGMTSQKGCDLAVRIDGKSYFVDGVAIDDFGDAHDENTGFCEVVRKAEIEGELIENQVNISSVNLLE